VVCVVLTLQLLPTPSLRPLVLIGFLTRC
jgi:hypothetical protein